MLTQSAIALAAVVLMLAIASGESSITSYPTAFNQFWVKINANAVSAMATVVGTLATIAIACFSYTLWTVNKQQMSDARVIQRAYVTISHSSPGVEVGKNGNFWHEAVVRNFGQTPARITDVVMKSVVVAHGQSLPIIPDYTCEDPGPSLQAFLVRDDKFFVPRFFSVTPSEMEQVRAQSADLYVMGFVDYVDQFGERHRAGYARIFSGHRRDEI
jgi:hypothetical protein